MNAQSKIEDVASRLLAQHDLQLLSSKALQSLWAGYGYIYQITATTQQPKTPANTEDETFALILKYISPPLKRPGQVADEGYIRKALSYQIEQFFYVHLAPQLPAEVAVARYVASTPYESSVNVTAMMLEDLRVKFPVAGEKRGTLNRRQTYAALKWLAGFHGFWWSKMDDFTRDTCCPPPLQHFADTSSTALQKGGIWLNGGYTYLATRRSEYESLASEDSEWSSLLCGRNDNNEKSVAELVADFLAPSAGKPQMQSASTYTTMIHGDVKSENLFITEDGSQVAFFDFQYVGLGLGVCDLAKLFTCSVSMQLLDGRNYGNQKEAMGIGEDDLLRFYHRELEKISGKKYSWDLLVRHWEVALVDWLRFQASWGFWGNTEWLERRVRHILQDESWRNWLHDQQVSS